MLLFGFILFDMILPFGAIPYDAIRFDTILWCAKRYDKEIGCTDVFSIIFDVEDGLVNGNLQERR